jgi:hypothetical protein
MSEDAENILGGRVERDSEIAASPRVRLRFAWYDLWVGAYIDRAKRVIYICPLPTLLVEVRYGR